MARWAGFRFGLLVLLALVGIAAISGVWDVHTGSADWYARVILVAVAAGFAVFAARERARVRGGMSRLRILDQVARAADGSLALAETLERVTGVVVPDFADLCMIDVIQDGDVQRVAVRAAGKRAREVEDVMRRRTPTLPERFVDPEASDEPAPFFAPMMGDEALQELAHDSEDLAFLRWLRLRSRIVVPLVSRGRRLGALTAIRRAGSPRYKPEDVGFAQVLAGRVGLVLDNAGLFSDLESVEHRMDSVMESLAEAVVVHDSSGKLIYANPAAAGLLGFEDTDDLVSGTSGTWDARFDIRDEEGRPLDPEELPRRRALRGEEVPAMVIGLSDRATGEESWRLERSTTIRGAADEVLYTVTTIEDITKVKEAEFAQRLLGDASQALSSSTEYVDGLQDLAATIVPRFADWCSVSVAGPDGSIEQLAVAHADPAKLGLVELMRQRYPERLQDGAGIAEVIRTGEPIVGEVSSEFLKAVAQDAEHLQLLEEIGAASMLLEPIKAAGHVIGALALVNGPARAPFAQRDSELAEQLAGRVGVAILNAKLASERAEIGDVLQRELLPPPLPEVPGWGLAGMYRPAGEQHQVGGDFYDVFEAREGWVLVVGDVEGRGAEAAALTAMVRYTIRTAAMLQGDVLQAFRLLNPALRERSERSEHSLCSVACVSLSPHGGATVVSAGHPLPLLVGNGMVQEVGRPGSLLGALQEPEWDPLQLDLSAGDQLILYTDGVVEARGDGGRFGRERLGSMLLRAETPRQVVRRVEAALDAFADPADLDDAALLALRREAVPTGASAPGRKVPAGEKGLR